MRIGYIFVLSTNPRDMYTSSLRHVHDSVLLSQDRNYTCFFINSGAQYDLIRIIMKGPARFETSIALWLMFQDFWNVMSNGKYSYAPHNDVSVNDGPHKRRWSH